MVIKMKYSALHSLLRYLFIVSSQSNHATLLTTDKAESTSAGYLNLIKYGITLVIIIIIIIIIII